MGSRKSKHIIPSTTLTEDQIEKMCQQLHLSPDEIRQRHSEFIHQYPHGVITREQFFDCLNEVWPETHIDKFASHLFATLDQDRNGGIDFMEYMLLTCKLDSGQMNVNDDENVYLGLLFDIFDRNHNGYLEKRELKPLVESIYDLAGLPEGERRGVNSSHAQVKYLLNKLDKNGDKRLSKQEFLNEENWNHDEQFGRLLFNY
ncbi:unnamed protein product [Adineta ricciae]|uniref:EF-hand domain-containing protein n=1 Tax=Adineta ricciae TaxID=249248 RepID=A0A814MGV5_ADIRI|nr:unnamed protein product [Adineta ricciae]